MYLPVLCWNAVNLNSRLSDSKRVTEGVLNDESKSIFGREPIRAISMSLMNF